MGNLAFLRLFVSLYFCAVGFKTSLTGVENSVQANQFDQAHLLHMSVRSKLETSHGEDNAGFGQILLQAHQLAAGGVINSRDRAGVDDQPAHW